MIASVRSVSQSLRSMQTQNTGIVPPYLRHKGGANGNTGIVPPARAGNTGIVPPNILEKIGHGADAFDGTPLNGNGGIVGPVHHNGNGGIVPPILVNPSHNGGIVPPILVHPNGNTGIVPPGILAKIEAELQVLWN